MNHLTHDELVLSYYREPDLDSGRRSHLEACDVCLSELAGLTAILGRVTPTEPPPLDADYEARTWDRLQWRLRGEQPVRRSALHSATRWLAAAAILTLAFLGGLLWNRRAVDAPSTATTTTTGTPVQQTAAQQQTSRDRVLLVIVGEHMEQSERVLVELANLDAGGDTDITRKRQRAEELLASNRLYRQSALDRGEESVATLLSELEPVLLQIARAPDQVSSDELQRMQKRVENKELVFKLRVVRADVRRDAATPSSLTDI